ncbi:MAG: hypothetical protein JW741_02225 [Sedimentisphaerales bacterium]|nr:hypothetical protein [Sedimentisphaerales bacterium]
MAVETIERAACRRVVCDQVDVTAAPSRVLLVPWGEVVSTKGEFTIDDASAAAMIATFLQHGADLPIDYEHQTLGGEFSSPDGRAPAAGWIRGLEAVPGEGVIGQVEWTERGRGVIAAREYRYLSPAVGVRQDDRRAVELHSVGLTNKPAIVGMKAIVNKGGESDLATENRMLRASLRAAYFEDARDAFFGQPSADASSKTQTIAAGSGRSATYAPPLSPGEQRQQIIASAAKEYVRESDGQMVLCTQRAWVDQALRDANMPILTANESREYGLSEEPESSKRRPAFTQSVNSARAAVEDLPIGSRRPAIIRKASTAFHADASIAQACSHRAWCNNALREAGMQPMTDAELCTHGILTND